MAEYTIGISEARVNFGKLVDNVVKTGRPVTVYRNNKPCVVISSAYDRKIPNEETQEAFEDIENEIKHGGGIRYSNVKDLMQALKAESS